MKRIKGVWILYTDGTAKGYSRTAFIDVLKRNIAQIQGWEQLEKARDEVLSKEDKKALKELKHEMNLGTLITLDMIEREMEE